jgi:hypothetical protein
VTLCNRHHLSITDNQAQINYDNQQWWWQDELGKLVDPLLPQPILVYLAEKVAYSEETSPAERQFHPKHEDEKTCPRCHGKGKLPKEEKRLNAPKRKYKTWSMGIPVDAGENGYEIWRSNLEAVTERVGAILGYSDTVPPYYVLIAVTADWLNQTDREFTPT